jgi:HD-like signal output (HDOD) protein
MAGHSEIEALGALIDRAGQLHSPPEVAHSLLKLTRDDDFDVQEVVECIERDPALAAKMLQVVNSSRYGLRSQVANLRQAVAYLGQRTVRLIAMTFSIVDTFTRGSAKQLYNEYWRRALTIACAAARVSDRVESLDRHDAYTAGLLADLGSLVFAQVEREDYVNLFRDTHRAKLVDAERDKYGFDHAAVGAHLLERWEFPSDTVEGIRRHHDESVICDLGIATRAGALLADAIWETDAAFVEPCRHWLATHYDIDIDGFTDLALACKEEVTLEAELYGVNLGAPIDCDQIIEEARRQYLQSSLSAAMDLDSIESVMDSGAPF